MLQNPWALFFLTAVAIPVAVHFLTRPRPTVLPVSTLRFVREVLQQRRSHHRLRDLLTLLFRTAAVLLMVAAVVRPRTHTPPLVSNDDDAEAVRVVLLDASQSMATVDGGAMLFERARAAAAEHLRYRPELRANLMLAAAWPKAVFEQPSQNFEALRDELARASVRPESLDLTRAFNQAAEMLAPRDPHDQRRREFVIISDFQRSNWSHADFSVLPEETRIQLESVAPKTPLVNVGVSGARLIGQTGEAGSGRVEVDIGNWSPVMQTVTVDVQVEEMSHRLTADCPPGRQTTLSDELALTELGWHTGVASLVASSDALSADDSAPITVEIRPRPSYLLITRQAASLRPSSSHFLECVLSPEITANSTSGTPQVVRSTPDKLDAELLARTDLIVIDHPGSLNPVNIDLLAGALRHGRPILYLAAENADATSLDRLTSEFGRALRLPVAFQPLPQGVVRRNQSLVSARFDARPFTSLGEYAAANSRDWRFSGGLASHPVAEAVADDILANYSDGSACLVLAQSDTAPIAILNADLGSSNLPAQAAFVPLMDDLVQLLTERRSKPSLVHCGQSLVERLPVSGVAASSLEIVGPSATSRETELGELHEESGSIIWRWPVVGGPGLYQIRQGPATVFAVAVTPPPDESQLEWLSSDVLEHRLASGNAVYYRDATDNEQPHDVWWTWLTIGCLLCLFCELVTLILFRT